MTPFCSRPDGSALASLAALAPTLQQLVAENAGQIVGTVRFGVAGAIVGVIGPGAHPRWRRRGVAAALIDAIATVTRHHNCRALSLYTIVQTGNLPVFKGLGFRFAAEEPGRYFIRVTGEALTDSRMGRSVDWR